MVSMILYTGDNLCLLCMLYVTFVDITFCSVRKTQVRVQKQRVSAEAQAGARAYPGITLMHNDFSIYAYAFVSIVSLRD